MTLKINDHANTYASTSLALNMLNGVNKKSHVTVYMVTAWFSDRVLDWESRVCPVQFPAQALWVFLGQGNVYHASLSWK